MLKVTLLMHWNYQQMFLATDGPDVNGLQLEKVATSFPSCIPLCLRKMLRINLVWNECVTIAVNRNSESQFKQLRNSPKKRISGLQRDSNPWPLRSRCSALPAELWRPTHWQAGQFIFFFYSINLPASSVWIPIAQLGEHCSADTEATGSNPVEPLEKLIFTVFRNCLNRDTTAMVSHSFHLYSRSSHHFIQ